MDHAETLQSPHQSPNEVTKKASAICVISQWKILVFGQGIALVAASANACSYTLIFNLGISLPMTEMCIMYTALALLYGGHVQRRGNPRKENQVVEPDYVLPWTNVQLHAPWWIYFGVSALDVGANLMTLLSFRFTSLTSTSLLGSLTIPSVMIVSFFLLKRVFRLPHYIGVSLCILGGTMTVLMDIDESNDTRAATPDVQPHSYVGDVLAIVAALLYGLGDSLAEYSIKHLDRFEYLFMIGLFGAVFTAIFALFFEVNQLYKFAFDTNVTIQWQACFGILFYVSGIVIYYISATLFLIHGDATLLVLSLQATQFWAILFSVVAEHYVPTPWFFVAVLLVVLGVFCYEICGGQSLPDETINSSTRENVECPEDRITLLPLEKIPNYCAVI